MRTAFQQLYPLPIKYCPKGEEENALTVQWTIEPVIAWVTSKGDEGDGSISDGPLSPVTPSGLIDITRHYIEYPI